MKAIWTFVLLFFANFSSGQTLLNSGEYDFGLKLAFSDSLNKVSGYFENYRGLDEKTGNPQFSCIFYFEGFLKGNKANIKTYYPEWKDNDLIIGTLEIKDKNNVTIKLPEEHGGCWNVQHFADEPVDFEIEKRTNWATIRYITENKSYFYADKNGLKKTKTYLIKGDIVCANKPNGDYIYCTYFGKKTTKGWLKTIGLNKL
jgi:hypothetical protein